MPQSAIQPSQMSFEAREVDNMKTWKNGNQGKLGMLTNVQVVRQNSVQQIVHTSIRNQPSQWFGDVVPEMTTSHVSIFPMDSSTWGTAKESSDRIEISTKASECQPEAC